MEIFILFVFITKILYIFGNNYFGQGGITNNRDIKIARKHPQLLHITDVSKGGNHLFVKNSSNEIFGLGDNQHT